MALILKIDIFTLLRTAFKYNEKRICVHGEMEEEEDRTRNITLVVLLGSVSKAAQVMVFCLSILEWTGHYQIMTPNFTGTPIAISSLTMLR